MNEITIHGNLTADPELRYSPGGVPVVTFTVAVNTRRYDRRLDRWTDKTPIFHRVVAFHALAENVAISITKGTTVTVTGQLADDSWSPDSTATPGGTRQYRTKLEATDIAVSLGRATAVISKVRRTGEPADQEVNCATD